ncbi:MAG: helix-turn-helix domain-containing protein [Chloroflexales bacterium]|nr:helix-turn-helix domain-containing protein [Chloroflexales bacterium]
MYPVAFALVYWGSCKNPHAGLAAARARGRLGGRPKGVDQKKQKAALALKKDAGYSIREICEIVGISRNTYYKYTRADATSHPPPRCAPGSTESIPLPQAGESRSGEERSG